MTNPSKLKYNIALSGEFELQEIKDADVFRVLRSLHANWKELIHNEEWMDATLDNELIAIIRKDPALYEKVLIYAAYAEIVDRLASDGRLVASIGAVFESLDMGVLSEASQAKLQEATEEGLVCEMLEYFNDAVDRAISTGEFNIRVDPVNVESNVTSVDLIYHIRDNLVEQITFSTNGNLESYVALMSPNPLRPKESFPERSKASCDVKFFDDCMLACITYKPHEKEKLIRILLVLALLDYRVDTEMSTDEQCAGELCRVMDKILSLKDTELSDTAFSHAFSDWLF